ncbi:MAG: cobalamin B12-binding domain-containing protein [Betaproteobacteria bacterium]|nr:cobalamin B12-binding domain-containing protein [Betaproteobacteria bacterium]
MDQRPAYRSSASAPATASEDSCKDSLRHVIESQIIPRLLEATALVQASNDAQTFYIPYDGSPQDVEAFAHSCMATDATTSSQFMDDLVRQEFSIESLFLNLITPAARWLGVQWETDAIDFMQVTLALQRMHHITHRLGYEFQAPTHLAEDPKSIMLASAPGSQHLLGLVMVSEFFRKAGWQVTLEITNSERELIHAVANEWFDLIGLSAGLQEQVHGLPSLIARLKKLSRNPNIGVLLGGPAFMGQDHQAHNLGADGIATDASQALGIADSVMQFKNPI